LLLEELILFHCWLQITIFNPSFVVPTRLIAFLSRASDVFSTTPLPKTNVLAFADSIDWQQGAFLAEGVPGVAGQILGFWDCCILATFSYTGPELIAITAHESEFQRRDLPKAVRRVCYRLIIYYTSIILVLGLTVSSSDPILLLSSYGKPNYPGSFIVMARRAGLPVVAHIINAAMIIATFSVATGDIYVVVPPVPSLYPKKEVKLHLANLILKPVSLSFGDVKHGLLRNARSEVS
jgi:L-asparagine transporter-like permease